MRLCFSVILQTVGLIQRWQIWGTDPRKEGLPPRHRGMSSTVECLFLLGTEVQPIDITEGDRDVMDKTMINGYLSRTETRQG